MKKNYQSPATMTVNVEMANLMQGTMTSMNSNVELNYRGGGSGPARGREGGSWDDDE